MRPFFSILALIGILNSCAYSGTEQKPSADNSTAPLAGVQTFVFECTGNFSFVVRAEHDRAWLFQADSTLDLPQTASTSGVRYASATHELKLHDNEASLVTDKGRYDGCRNNHARAIWEHAKLNGVDFRATGNEPGWYLEISDRTDILLVTDYGQSRRHFASATLRSDPLNQKTVYNARNDEDTVEITITGDPCHDSMSGEAFSAMVSVRLNDARYQGCGKALH